jgi:hypothetical protein
MPRGGRQSQHDGQVLAICGRSGVGIYLIELILILLNIFLSEY